MIGRARLILQFILYIVFVHTIAVKDVIRAASVKSQTVKHIKKELRKSLGTWLREISSCSCLTFLPGPARVLLSKICKDFF